MDESPLKEKNKQVGNVKKAGLKVAETTERVKEYGSIPAMQKGDTLKEPQLSYNFV